MEFHIARDVRTKYGVDELLFGYTGNAVFANVAASRKLAQAINDVQGTEADPAKAVNAGALFAMGLIDELNHAMVARYRAEMDPAVLSEGLLWLQRQADPAAVYSMLQQFTEQFPNVAIFRGEVTSKEWLAGTTEGLSNREAALEELLMLWLANSNPGFRPFRELFEDERLKKATIYADATAALPGYFETRPAVSPEIGSLLDALRAPFLASPDSLTGQLEFIREHWSEHLGADLRRVLLAIDVIREEDIAVWMRFNPPGPDQHRHRAPGWSGEGFEGDEYVGFEGEWFTGPDGVRQRRYATDYQAPLLEYEAFSADQAWMPNVVLMAKSTYVWLEQLSKKYQRHIHRLDHIPDEELRLLAERGITGLWLIGLWERSVASRTIKRLRGQADAVASAYSLKDYAIAEDLGGTGAYEHLRDRARAFGLRLASDMVPNHMGIDSSWVIDHPDWFISRWESPFPSYRFEGPDLSSDSRVEIKIEDHYYDQTDAAVAFRLRHHAQGTTRYMYHGNDGTTFAWNDTAQLDYSKAEVREYVIQVILHVARQFPIIRFDAAMVLAKRHVQRLWFPLPGAGGSIPSRAENAMSQEEFEAVMPHEFWREVVDRVAAEVPGTLLLAEAFWMLEGYFVRTLGMHRVYNSAFMNMLRDEENAKYRSYLKKTIEFDPDILKRYVNFMSNPDERTTIDQFGSGDKCFGVATLMSTLPGLPMFGHGQIEGYTERYGMEYKQAKMDEWPDEGLVARHQHEIAPLLKNRRIFAESANFLLYDFWNDHGTVDENVFAYSNRMDGERSIILYNNAYSSTRGSIHVAAASMDKGSGELRQRSLAEGLALPYDHEVVLAYRDTARGLEYLRRAKEFHHNGFSIELRGYQYAVLVGWRELRHTAEHPWGELCDALGGAGVPSVDEALSKLRVRPVHEALKHALGLANAAVAKPAEKAAAAPETGSEATLLSNGEGTQLPAKLTSTAEIDRKKAEPGVGVAAGAERDAQKPAGRGSAEFVAAGEAFAARVSEMMKLEAGGSGAVSSTAMKAEPEGFGAKFEQLVRAAGKLPELTARGVASWPAEAVKVLPSVQRSGAADDIWLPVLAYALLQSLEPKFVPAEVFDTLLLRGALAEMFGAHGLHGEAAWQAAARVRVLLRTEAAPGQEVTRTASFWRDEDVRWLAGVNEVEGTAYFNRERFESLLCWMELPALLTRAEDPLPAKGSAAESVQKLSEAAERVGYRVDAYVSGRESDDTEVSEEPLAIPEEAFDPPDVPEKPTA